MGRLFLGMDTIHNTLSMMNFDFLYTIPRIDYIPLCVLSTASTCNVALSFNQAYIWRRNMLFACFHQTPIHHSLKY